jgi:hypothetical protein
MSPQSGACQERQKLAQKVVDAITTVYKLRNEYSSAQAKKSANTDELLIQLSEARGVERICGVPPEGLSWAPPLLHALGAPVAGWDLTQIIAAIECAAARRS